MGGNARDMAMGAGMPGAGYIVNTYINVSMRP